MNNKPQKPVSTAELVEEKFYWVQPYHGELFEPAKCKDFYGNGNMYFHFTNGGIMEVKSVWEYKELEYKAEEPIKVQLTLAQMKSIYDSAKSLINEAERQNNDNISQTVEIIVTDKCEYHLGGDSVSAFVKVIAKDSNPYRIY